MKSRSIFSANDTSRAVWHDIKGEINPSVYTELEW